jgi:hypothetical protein
MKTVQTCLIVRHTQAGNKCVLIYEAKDKQHDSVTQCAVASSDIGAWSNFYFRLFHLSHHQV